MKLKVLFLLAFAMLSAGLYWGWRRGQEPSLCGGRGIVLGARCCAEGQKLDAQKRCQGKPARCPANFALSSRGCEAIAHRVEVPAGTLHGSPSADWEQQERPRPSVVQVPRFWIDNLEVSESRYQQCVTSGRCPSRPQRGEGGLPQMWLGQSDAKAYCRFVGGRLPRLAELQRAASQDRGRYPWGQTGLVCRRLAFGLQRGPCRHGGGPQLVGFHPDGATTSGIFDLAGNAAEWTEEGLAFGGSWRSRQASELRVWSFRRMDPRRRYDDIGVRCVYETSGR